MQVKREEFLTRLELLQPGLSPQDTIEQSSCFCFQGGWIYTYNEEIACRIKFPSDLSGAVAAKPLLSLLHKMIEEEIEIESTATELRIAGKSLRAGIRLEAEISLPFDKVERPESWADLPEGFAEAVGICEQCASQDESQAVLTYLHLHPKWIEACDNIQATRYRIATGLAEPVLVRRDSIKPIVALGMSRFAETETWLHFRNPAGLFYSCRRFVEDYPSMTEFLKIEGEPTTLPRGLAEAADRANVFASENAEFDHIVIDLRPGKVWVSAEGSQGWIKEPKKLKYAGKRISFSIAPKILAEIVKKNPDCEITKDRLKINGGRWRFVTCLGVTGKEIRDESE